MRPKHKTNKNTMFTEVTLGQNVFGFFLSGVIDLKLKNKMCPLGDEKLGHLFLFSFFYFIFFIVVLFNSKAIFLPDMKSLRVSLSVTDHKQTF